MNENGKDDLRLKELLSDWKTHEPLPPGFQERVWRRIEKAELAGTERGTTRWPEWLAVLFARPVFATACAGALLALGLAAGLWRADHDAARWDNDLANRYVASVNPYNR